MTRVAALVGLVVLAVTAGVSGSPAGAREPDPLVSPSQPLVVLLTKHDALSTLPPRRSPVVSIVQASRPITGVRTVLPVLGSATTPDGARWLRVMLPGRPNGAEGWITQAGTRLTSTTWYIRVETSSRRVLVYRRGLLTRTFAAIVGKPSTPTPRGRFFVEEPVRIPGGVGGPFALALSARSNVLQDFDGGPGQIAIHGLENLGGAAGTAVSHGCVRLSDANITWLVTRIGPGVRVTVGP
jgi:L,D-transpeptidase catalytic domain